MPYNKISELPPPVKDNLPTHAEEIYMSAYNSAWKQHSKEKDAEIICNKIAWDAVKRSYKKNTEGKWVTKEGVSMKLSNENKKNLLQSALIVEYGLKVESPAPKKLSIEEVFDNELVYDIDGQLYQSSYELGENGTPTFGEPKKVLSTKIFKAIESLRSTYSEILQEAGRRNASLDAARIKKIVELCQELLSSEEPEEKEAKEALKEAASVLKMIKEQDAMKTEDGVKFPSEAFAYVPDSEKPSEWKLRLWEDPTKKITRKQLGAAAAALSPGGFRGQRVDIPGDDLPAVKRKIRTAYRSLDVSDEEMPRWVKESETRELIGGYMPLTEATFDKGRARVIVIKAGFNADHSRYYPSDVLKRDYGIFENMKMYADHPTEAEEKDRPERSIKDWVATLTEVKCDDNGVVTGIAEIVEPWLMQKLASLRDKQMLSEMGISINAVGSATKGIIEGKETLVIEKLVAARSVDFVTEPGAGGIVTFYESRELDIDLVGLATLKEKRPDLVKAISNEVRTEITKEVKKTVELEEQVREKDTQIEALTTERDALKTQIVEAEKAKAKAEAQAAIKEAVDKAELPDAAKKRLMERFKDAESADGIEEAVKSEIDYIAQLSEAGKVKNMGPTNVDSDKDKEALKESFKRSHPEWTDAQLETAVSGR